MKRSIPRAFVYSLIGSWLLMAGVAMAASPEQKEKSAPACVVIYADPKSGDQLEPSESEVKLFNEKLAALFEHPDKRMSDAVKTKLSGYCIRIYARTESGRRLIIGEAESVASRSVEKFREKWAKIKRGEEIIMHVFGGGPAFFEATFDVEKKEIVKVQFGALL